MVQLLDFSGPRGSLVALGPSPTVTSSFPGTATPALARAGVLMPQPTERHLSPLLPPSPAPRSDRFVPGPSYHGYVLDDHANGSWAPICLIPPRSRLSRAVFYGPLGAYSMHYALYAANAPITGVLGIPDAQLIWPPITGIVTAAGLPVIKAYDSTVAHNMAIYYAENVKRWLILFGAVEHTSVNMLQCTVTFELEV